MGVDAATAFSRPLDVRTSRRVVVGGAAVLGCAVALLTFGGIRGEVAAVGVVGAVALTQIIRSQTRTRPRHVSEGIRFSAVSSLVVLVVAALTLDFRGTLAAPGAARYLVVVAGIAIVGAGAVGRSGSIREAPRASDAAILALCIWGTVGSLLARTILDAQTSALALCSAAAFALLPVVAPDLNAQRSRSLLGIAAVGGSIYSILAALNAHGLVPGVSNAALFSHEESYLLVLGVASSMARKWWPLMGAQLLCDALIFAHYPAATYILAVVAALGAVAAVRVPIGRRGLYALAAVLAATVVLLVTLWSALPSFLGHYFSAVNKGNNTSFRQVLWATTIEHWRPHPLLGASFVGEGDLTFHVNGKYITDPSHCDYLQLLALGGLVGLGMFLLWAGSVLVRAVGACRAIAAADRGQPEARLLIVLLAAFVTMLTTAAVNPVSARPVGAAALFVLGALTDALARQLGRGDA